MAKVNCYLAFNGTCEAAFNFYKSVFGSEFSYIGYYKDMPCDSPIPEENQNLVMHICLPISAETKLLGCDVTQGYISGNNVSIAITPESEDDALRIFNALSEGGTVIMPMEKTFWNSLFGMFTDKFGITWLVDYGLDCKG
ncbi:MAG: VOC family protein [Tannerellaceae bacterium]|jgi:PhnB protein|nr:VOC family protein [Tannerellaceae bacterium]